MPGSTILPRFQRAQRRLHHTTPITHRANRDHRYPVTSVYWRKASTHVDALPHFEQSGAASHSLITSAFSVSDTFLIEISRTHSTISPSTTQNVVLLYSDFREVEQSKGRLTPSLAFLFHAFLFHKFHTPPTFTPGNRPWKSPDFSFTFGTFVPHKVIVHENTISHGRY